VFYPSKILVYAGLMGVKTVVTVLAQGNQEMHVVDGLQPEGKKVLGSAPTDEKPLPEPCKNDGR